MKKTMLISIISLAFLSISSTVAYFLRYIDLIDWVPLGIGVFIALLGGIVYAVIREKKFSSYLGLGINAISLGFLIRAWYIFRRFDNALWLMLLVSLLCISCLWIFYILTAIPFIKRHSGWFLLIFVILSLIGYVFLIAFTTTTWVSTLGFYMIIEIAFIIGLCWATDSQSDLMTNALYCSYSIFIVAIIIAIAMLGGDGFDFSFDIGGVGGGKKPPRKKTVNKL